MSEIVAVFSMKYQKVLSYKNTGVTHKKVHTIFRGTLSTECGCSSEFVGGFFFLVVVP